MKLRNTWLCLALVSLFLLAALSGCGQDNGENPVEEPAQTGSSYALQAGEEGSYTVLLEGETVGGAAWLAYPGAEEAAHEPLEQLLDTLWDQWLGQGAEAPDHTASVCIEADLEVSFVTDQGSELHYLVASGDAFYDIWFQEGALPLETEREILYELLAEVQG